jgi:hypothetical protein
MKQIFFASILALIFSFSVFAQTENNSLCAKTPGTAGVVQAGTPMKFVATLSGKTDGLTLGYEWKVSAGTIISGQGTCSIVVDTTGLSNVNITAEVTITGLPACCPNVASETGSVVAKPERELWDEFGPLSNDDVKARIQNLYVELGNYPNGQGYIIIYGTEKEMAARERQIHEAVRFLNFDGKRLTIVRGGANPRGAGAWSKVWIVLPGAELPRPDDNE